jgi:hypothetical protein
MIAYTKTTIKQINIACVQGKMELTMEFMM